MQKYFSAFLAFGIMSASFFSLTPGVALADDMEFVEGEVLVQFKPGNTPTAQLQKLHNIDSALQLNTPGLQHMQEENSVNLPSKLDRIYEVTAEQGDTTEELVHSLEADPRVAIAEPNYIYELTEVPNDTGFANLWGMDNSGAGGVADADIDASDAWDLRTDASSVVVAVIDSGIDYTHPDLVDNMWVNPGEVAADGIDNDGNGYIDDIYGWDFFNGDSNPYDDNSHGTHVAGTIGAVGNNAQGVAGVAWNTQLAALKVCGANGACSTSAILNAVLYAASMEIPLSNNSYGGGGYSSIMQGAIDASGANAGHLYIAAAGNAANNNDITPFYPASYQSDYIVSVASTTKSDVLSSFSNYGATSVDIAAPGSSIYSTTPGGLYAYKSGTSMATPHVAGAAALTLGYAPTLTPLELRNTLITTGDVLDSLNGRVVNNSRLNVYSALLALGNTAPVADLTADATTATEGEEITFDASGSTDADGDELTFTWDFGNSDTADSGTTPTAAARFGVAGTYEVTVTVSDSVQSDAASMTVTINGLPLAEIFDTPDDASPETPDDASPVPVEDDPVVEIEPDTTIVFVDDLKWKKNALTGWKLTWKNSNNSLVTAQLIRKKKNSTKILKRWDRTAASILQGKKVREYFKNHPKQLHTPEQLRIRLVVTPISDSTLRVRQSIALPRSLFNSWKNRYAK